jgi:hypothetical protein
MQLRIVQTIIRKSNEFWREPIDSSQLEKTGSTKAACTTEKSQLQSIKIRNRSGKILQKIPNTSSKSDTSSESNTSSESADKKMNTK